MSLGDADDLRYQLLYEHAARGIDRQATRLAESRARAGGLFSAASIAAAFLAAETFKPGSNPGPFAWLGAGAFAVTGCFLAYVLLPRKWAFMIKQTRLRELVDADESLGTMQNSLAEQYAKNYDSNEPRLTRLAQALALMALSVVVEIISFIVNLVLR